MATPLDIFLDTSETLETVHVHLAKIVGHSLQRHHLDVGPIYVGKVLDIELRMFDDHGLVDDCGISFTEYSHQICLDPFKSALPVAGFEKMYEAAAKFLAAKLAIELDCRTMVVANLQRKLASFGPTPDDL